MEGIEGAQLFKLAQGTLTTVDPLFKMVSDDIDRKEKEWGLTTAPPNDHVSDKVTVTIRDGVIALVPSADRWTAVVQIFLRIAVVNNRPPATKLYQWHLDLRDQQITVPTFISGSGSPIFKRLISTRPTLMQQPQAVKPDRVDKWLDIVSHESPLPPAIGENGWLTFQFPVLSLYHAFGHTYRLNVRDENGTTYHDEKAPGTWLEPVEVDWSDNEITGIGLQGYG